MAATPNPGEEAAKLNVAKPRPFEDLRQDYAMYNDAPWLGRLWWLTERPFWAIVAYRVGQAMLRIEHPVMRRLSMSLYGLIIPFVHGLTGVEIWPTTKIGPGLRIQHGAAVIIHPLAVVGANCELRQGVTIGIVRPGDPRCPVIGDNVSFGAYAQVLGAVTVGDHATIGALSLVLRDVPAGATAVGIPARLVTSGQDVPPAPNPLLS